MELKGLRDTFIPNSVCFFFFCSVQDGSHVTPAIAVKQIV